MSDKKKWIYAFASSIGNSHIIEQIQCQDACNVIDFCDYSISVVSDGAGSSMNSHLGSMQVIDSCFFHFENAINYRKWTSNNLPDSQQWHELAKQVLFSVKEDLE